MNLTGSDELETRPLQSTSTDLHWCVLIATKLEMTTRFLVWLKGLDELVKVSMKEIISDNNLTKSARDYDELKHAFLHSETLKSWQIIKPKTTRRH